MLKMIGIELEKISDIDKYLFIEKGTRGGISYTSKRESAKLRAWRACVLTCLACLRAWRAWRARVLACMAYSKVRCNSLM